MLRVAQLFINLLLERIVPHEDNCVPEEVDGFILNELGQFVVSDVEDLELHQGLLYLFLRSIFEIPIRTLNFTDFVVSSDENLKRAQVPT